jgi:hypothetical protein
MFCAPGTSRDRRNIPFCVKKRRKLNENSSTAGVYPRGEGCSCCLSFPEGLSRIVSKKIEHSLSSGLA